PARRAPAPGRLPGPGAVRALVRLPDAVLRQLGQQLVAAQGPAGVLLLDLADEVLHVVVALGVLDVLAVGVARLEGVVLDADEVVDDVVGRGVVAAHAVSCLLLVASPARRLYHARGACNLARQ